MEVNRIDDILARYYDGETTETEERELKRFFSEEEIPVHLLAEKEFFLQMAVQPEPKLPEGLEDRLIHRINEWDAQEKRTLKREKRVRGIRMQWIGSVAASLLILLSVGMYIYKPNASPIPQDTCATPEEAYTEAQRALLLFSSTLNKGMEQVETARKTTQRMQETVNQQLNRINTSKP